jgi:hypothetical protein
MNCQEENMSKVIEFLDAMGRDAQMRHADAGDVALALERAEIGAELREAILGGDQSRLEQLLGARTNVICGFAPAKDDDDQEKAPDDDEEIVARRDVRVA